VRQLEREWEECLVEQQQLEESYHRFLHEHPRLLSPTEQAAIRQLAVDIPALWHATTTTAAERKEILRQVLSRVVVTTQGETELVQVRLEWVGGATSEESLTRPVARLEQLSYYPQLCERVRALAVERLSAAAIADRLNSEGYRPPKRCEQFGSSGVRDLLRRLGLCEPQGKARSRPRLGTDEWWLQDLACHLGMPAVTLYQWIQRGRVQAHQEAIPPRRWIVWADAVEVARLRQLHQQPAGSQSRRLWLDDPDCSAENDAG
jgi:hypothetical protein